jgi:hypothetical protein
MAKIFSMYLFKYSTNKGGSMFSTKGRSKSFLCSFFVMAACLLILNSSVSAVVYQIEAQSVSSSWSDFSITYNDSNPYDDCLLMSDIISFSGVVAIDSDGDTWGPYETVAGTPHLTLIFGELAICPNTINLINWVFCDPDNNYHILEGNLGNWTYNTVYLGTPSVVMSPTTMQISASAIINDV